jgi:hypothetical protein
VDPSDSGVFLQFTLEDKKYRFNLIDRGPEGMGMLVSNEEAEVLEQLKPGDILKTEYRAHEHRSSMRLKIQHITPRRSGTYQGDYQVGLSLVFYPEAD